MPVVQHTLLQLDGVTPLIGRKCTVGQVGAALTGGTQTSDHLTGLTDSNGRAQFTLAASATGTYYVWTDPDGSTYTFAVPSTGSGPFNLTDLLINTPGALPYTPVGSVGVSPTQLSSAQATTLTAAEAYADTHKLDKASNLADAASAGAARLNLHAATDGLPAYAPAGLAGVFDRRSGLFNVTPDNNRTFATALSQAAVGAGVCHDVVIGASGDVVYDGTSVRSPLSWSEYYRQTLVTQGVPSGGTGLFPACDTLGIPSDTRVAVTGTWQSFGGAFAYGHGTYTFTPDVSGGQLVIAYDNDGGLATQFTVKIGAASAVTVTPTGAASVGVYAPSGTIAAGTPVLITTGSTSMAFFHIGTVGTTGYHKHNLARSSMGACIGAPPFASAAQGAWDPTVAPDYYDPGRAAYSALAPAGTLTAASSVGATSLSSTVPVAVGSTVTIDTGGNLETAVVSAVTGSGPYTLTVPALTKAHASGVAISGVLIAAHRLTINLGGNDLANSITVAQVLAALPRIIAAVPKATGCTIRLMLQWQLSLIPAATWEALGAALYSFADTNGYQLVDWRWILGNAAAVTAAGLIGADGYHVVLGPSSSFGRKLALADLAAS